MVIARRYSNSHGDLEHTLYIRLLTRIVIIIIIRMRFSWCAGVVGHVHAYTDGSGMEIDVDDTLEERIAAGV